MKRFPVLFTCLVVLMASCKTGSKTTIEDILATQRNIKLPDSIINKQKKGIDLFASGNLPAAWTLEVDYDKMVSFRTTDGVSLDVLPAFDQKEAGTVVETYGLQTDLGPMKILVYKSGCETGDTKTQHVEVSLQNKIYRGCGMYLFDHRINDIWELETINNEQQQAADYPKGLPTMKFDLQQNKMTGSDGCGPINSGIEVKGNRIKFSVINGLNTSCKNNLAGKVFAEMISDKLVDYYEENGQLFLYLADDSKMVFTRKHF